MKTKVNDDMLRRANERIDVLVEIEAQQARVNQSKGQLKELKKRDIADGYDDRAMTRVVAELRMEPDEFQEVLAFEVEHQAYRSGVGLPQHSARRDGNGNLGISDELAH
jgi:hypothetical protein